MLFSLPIKNSLKQNIGKVRGKKFLANFSSKRSLFWPSGVGAGCCRREEEKGGGKKTRGRGGGANGVERRGKNSRKQSWPKLAADNGPFSFSPFPPEISLLSHKKLIWKAERREKVISSICVWMCNKGCTVILFRRVLMCFPLFVLAVVSLLHSKAFSCGLGPRSSKGRTRQQKSSKKEERGRIRRRCFWPRDRAGLLPISHLYCRELSPEQNIRARFPNRYIIDAGGYYH